MNYLLIRLHVPCVMKKCK